MCVYNYNLCGTKLVYLKYTGCSPVVDGGASKVSIDRGIYDQGKHSSNMYGWEARMVGVGTHAPALESIRIADLMGGTGLLASTRSTIMSAC